MTFATNTMHPRVGILIRNGKNVYYVIEKDGKKVEFSNEVDASNHANILEAFNK